MDTNGIQETEQGRQRRKGEILWDFVILQSGFLPGRSKR